MYPLVTTPHPCLRQPTRLVGDRLTEEPDRWSAMAEQLRIAMHRHNGVGIAAPQLAMRSRLCVLRDGTVMVDPQIIASSDDTVDSREGCLSLPGEAHVVKRAEWVRYVYRNLQGNVRNHLAFGFEATVIQHELDHLDGVLLDVRARA